MSTKDVVPADLVMTAKAAEAFAAYVAMGSERSLAKLSGGNDGVKVGQLERWSAKYGWQERLRRFAQQQIEAANDRRLEIWLRTIGVYDAKTRQEAIDRLSLGDVHSIHDRVRPIEAGGAVAIGPSVTINIGTRPDGPALQE